VVLGLSPTLLSVPPVFFDRFRVQFEGTGGSPGAIQTSTDLLTWTDVYTNFYGLPVALGTSPESGTASAFYRTRPLSLQPALRLQPAEGDGFFRLEVDGAGGVPYVLQATEDWNHWMNLTTNLDGGTLAFVDWETPNFQNRFYRAWVPSILPTITALEPAWWDGTFQLRTGTIGGQPYVIQASEDLMNWTDLWVNAFGGTVDYNDFSSWYYPQRFYRAQVLPAQPELTPPTGENLVQLHLDGIGGVPYIIQTSPDEKDWTNVFTNLNGGSIEFVDTQPVDGPALFYRVIYQTVGIRGSK
jgi:hypothetical protein